ncbi:hypothetical protein OG422_12345 [Streptomyces sp. NBC_01525]|uniref:hypothetical protein n=1 Tax=Streptomyces sp. NBC_01525 TaxID=2903893 RepID=UPI003868C226
MRPWALAPLVALLPLALVAGCAGFEGFEGLQSDGRAREVKAPFALWTDHSPAPPSRSDNPVALKPVPHTPHLPSGSMADADPRAVLDADLAADGQKPPAPGSVRRPVLHDLTDDGKPELIMAVDLDDRTSDLRVYSVRHQIVTRVLALRGVLAGVELAAGHLVVREPTKDPRYVSVTDYLWDKDRMTLWDLTLDDAHKPQPARSGTPGPVPPAPPAGASPTGASLAGASVVGASPDAGLSVAAPTAAAHAPNGERR